MAANKPQRPWQYCKPRWRPHQPGSGPKCCCADLVRWGRWVSRTVMGIAGHAGFHTCNPMGSWAPEKIPFLTPSVKSCRSFPGKSHKSHSILRNVTTCWSKVKDFAVCFIKWDQECTNYGRPRVRLQQHRKAKDTWFIRKEIANFDHNSLKYERKSGRNMSWKTRSY